MVTPCGGRSPTSYHNKVCRCSDCHALSLAHSRARDAANREKRQPRERAFYQKHRERILERSFRKSYGITYAERDALILAQGGVCAVCNKPPECGPHSSSRQLQLDHCHGTGAIRGMLCTHCNRALGLFKDDPRVLRAAADYLERFDPPPKACP